SPPFSPLSKRKHLVLSHARYPPVETDAYRSPDSGQDNDRRSSQEEKEVHSFHHATPQDGLQGGPTTLKEGEEHDSQCDTYGEDHRHDQHCPPGSEQKSTESHGEKHGVIPRIVVPDPEAA